MKIVTPRGEVKRVQTKDVHCKMSEGAAACAAASVISQHEVFEDVG